LFVLIMARLGWFWMLVMAGLNSFDCLWLDMTGPRWFWLVLAACGQLWLVWSDVASYFWLGKAEEGMAALHDELLQPSSWWIHSLIHTEFLPRLKATTRCEFYPLLPFKNNRYFKMPPFLRGTQVEKSTKRCKLYLGEPLHKKCVDRYII
jgi:hypothetical protein